MSKMATKNKEFLQLFWNLSTPDISKRKNAVKDLLNYFAEVMTESESSDIRTYTLKRLAKGMRSIRNLARMGYGFALCVILEKFGNEIDRSHIMTIVKEELYDASIETKAEGTAQKIGQLFITSILCRAGLMKQCSLEETKWLLKPIIPLLEQPDFRILSSYAISYTISQLKSKDFVQILLPSVESYLTVGWKEVDPESFLLLLSASSSHPSVLDRTFLKQHWDSKRLLAKEEHQTAALALLERSFEGREGALTTSHPLCGALAKALIADPSKLTPLWRAALQRGYEDQPSKAAAVKAKAALLHLFCELIWISADDPKALLALAEEGTPVDLLCKQLARPNLTLHSMAAHFASFKFPAWCDLATPESRGAVLGLLTAGTVDFDRELSPNLRLVQPLVGRVGREPLVSYGAALREAFVEPEAQQAFLANQMRLLIVNGEALSDTDIQEMLVFMAQPLMAPKAPAPADPLVAAFFKTLEWLACARRFRCTGLFLRKALRPLLKHAAAAASARASKPVGSVLRRALQLVPKKGQEADEGCEVPHMFALLFTFLGLHALADARGMDALLQDVENCFGKATGGKAEKEQEEEELHWTEVMTDCLLSLLSQGSRLLRTLVRLAFARMMRHLTPTCAKLLTDVMLARVEQRRREEDEEEEEDLLDFQNEDDEEEEEDAEDEDEEKTDGNGMEVDDDEEDSSEEEEEEAEDQAALQRIRENVRSALGKAALDEDKEAGSDMDDAAMFRIDSALAEAFKAASKGGHTKKAVVEKKRQLLQLKSRCLDLVVMVLSQSIDPAVIEPCLRACVELLRRPDEAELKISDALAALKKRQHPMASAGAAQLLKDGVRALCRLAHKAPPIPAFSSGVASASLFLLKALGPEDQRSLVQEEVTRILDDRSAAGKGLLPALIERHPALGWSVREDLARTISKADLRPFHRTQALALLSVVLKFNAKQEDAPAFLARCAGLAADLLEVPATWEHPALARRGAELAVTATQSPELTAAVRGRLSATAGAHLGSKIGPELRTALRKLTTKGPPGGGGGGGSSEEKKKKKLELRKQKREEKKKRRGEKERRRNERKRTHAETNGDGAPLEEEETAATATAEEEEEPAAKRKRRRKSKSEEDSARE